MRIQKITFVTVIFLLLGAIVCHAGSSDRLVPFTFSRVTDYPECVFENLDLPDHFVVYAAGAYGGRELSFQIDQSGEQATQIDVVVNAPEQPVVLMLGAYKTTIWNISWSSETKIVAVLVSGYHEQRVAGLSEKTPLLISSNRSQKKCPDFHIPDKVEHLNALSNDLFGRDVERVFPAKNGKVVVGTPLADDTKLITASRITPESFYDRNAPLAGQAGLDDAVKKGILRPATMEDVRAWQDAMAQKEGLKASLPPVAGMNPDEVLRRNVHPKMMHKAYAVLKPFRIPAGLYGGRSATFYVLKGVPMPTGNPGHVSIYDFNTMTEIGPGGIMP